MKRLVERIRNRELAIENDGSLEDINRALLHCFPGDIKVNDSTEKSKFFYAHEDEELTDRWDYSNTTNLKTVSVKEVLAEIEGEGKQTKLIYLNEEDKPKIEELLGFVEWLYTKTKLYNGEPATKGWKDSFLNKMAREYAEYLNNFKPNDKPIEFEEVYIKNKGYTKCHNTPKDKDIVIVVDKNHFIAINKEGDYAQWRFKGNLNNGKVK